MRRLVSSLAALVLSLAGTSALTLPSMTPGIVPAVMAAAPVAVVLVSPGKAEAQRRRAGAPRPGGHHAGVRSGGRHTVHRNVHRPAARPHPGRPGYGRDYRPAHHGHYSRRDMHHHYHHDYRRYYDGYRWGTAAAATAAGLAVGTVVASLPSGCTGATVNGVYYQRCNGTWFAPQYAGSDVTYAVVEAPR
ncbi:MAG: hypothetical protein ACOC91_00640 [bacterium]